MPDLAFGQSRAERSSLEPEDSRGASTWSHRMPDPSPFRIDVGLGSTWQGVDADLRPGLELAEMDAEGVSVEEFGVGEPILTRGDGWPV
jgi:hypothetical protein